MQKGLPAVASNLLLSASVLMWGMVPPAIRHSHEGGTDPEHRHDAVAEYGQEHGGHHDGADHRHEEWRLSVSVALRAFAVHLHWDLFGVDFSMPASQDGEQDTRAFRSALIRLVDELPTLIPGGRDSQSVPWVAPAAPAPDLVAVPTSPSRPPNLVASMPLCDRARRERSGVLLA